MVMYERNMKEVQSLHDPGGRKSIWLETQKAIKIIYLPEVPPNRPQGTQMQCSVSLCGL